jgi:hypothetical protein
MLQRISLTVAAVFFAVVPAAFAAKYYVSNQGDDRMSGTSPDTAWATLDRVNQGPFLPGDSILFRRGDLWRGQLIPQSGSKAGPIAYAAYGEGDKPLFLGSISKSNPEDWIHEGGNVWSAGNLDIDVGNIIFGNEEVCGIKKWRAAELKKDYDYWYDADSRKVKLYLSENPARRHSRIECAMRRHGISQSGRSYVCYENLAVKYAGAHGIGGHNTHHIVVRRCDFGYIGGGNHHKTVRFGNGIEFWAAAHDNLVEECRLWEIYDAALTNQSNGPSIEQYNITYRNNVIWNSEYSFEYWNRPERSQTRDIYFINNTCLNAGHGWAHAQRPDPSGRHLCFFTSPARIKNFVIRDNIFYEAKKNAFFAPTWTREQIDALTMDHNAWHQAEGIMIELKGCSYPMSRFAQCQYDWGKERHSLCAVPKFFHAAKHDYRQTEDSPCLGLGAINK